MTAPGTGSGVMGTPGPLMGALVRPSFIFLEQYLGILCLCDIE